MNILLLNPPHAIPHNPSYSYPLGIASILSVLEENAYTPKFQDFFHFLDEDNGWQKIVEKLSSQNPDIIGISVFTENRISALKLASLSKELFPQAKIILGGPHPTVMYMQLLQNYNIDAVVIGEGEITFLEIVKAIEQNKSFETINGIAYKSHSGKIKITRPRDLIPNLDILPIPAYHHFNLSERPSAISGMQVVFSRGCPFKCQFCAESAFWQNKFRPRSIHKCIDELFYLTNHYSFPKFIFFDALLSVNKKRTIELCKAIIEKEINIKWGARLRLDNIDKETLLWLKKAGCIGISYGVESGSRKILNNINKKISIDQIVRGFDLTHEAGLKVEASLIVGSPGESWKTIFETDSLLKKILPDKMYIIPAKIYPGTPLYNVAKQKGLINDDYWLSDKPVPHFTEKFSSGKLLFFKSLLNVNQLESNAPSLTFSKKLEIYCKQFYIITKHLIIGILQQLKIIKQ